MSTATARVMQDADATKMYVTMRVDKQLLGVPVEFVRDVLRPQKITPVPLASKTISGSLNLRGRIVTVIDVRRRLELAEDQNKDNHMFIVVEHKGDLYSLVVDSVGDVMTVPAAAIEKVPANITGSWRDVSSGVYKLERELLVIVDVATLLSLK